MTKPDRVADSDLREILERHLENYWPGEKSGPKTITPRTRATKSGLTLRLLRVIPWLLLALFITSFIWDFEGLSLLLDDSGIYLYSSDVPISVLSSYSGLGFPAFSRMLDLEGLIVTISAAGLIGFFTNWLAITMLFHPRRNRPLLGQGIIPAYRERIADLIALAISRDLISEEVIQERIRLSGVVPKYRDMALQVSQNLLSDAEFQQDIKVLANRYLREKLQDPALKQKLVALVMEKIDSSINRGIAGMAVKMYQMLNRDGFQRQIEKAIDDLPESADLVVDELDHLFETLPEKISQQSDDIEQWLTTAIMAFVNSLDIYDMVSKNLLRYDERQLEDLIKSTSSDQLIYLKYLGGALGAVGGLIIFDQWLALPALAIIVALLLMADHLVSRILKRRSMA
ncbi:MAG: DUF445 family protein [Rhodothermaceae bacterium]|nr:DUF445 family protein [Rhodothermaceae bacterium]